MKYLDWDYIKEKDKYIITFENGKKYFVKEKDIDNLQAHLKVSVFEAIELWLEDNNYIQNDIQNELDKQAKENKSKVVAKSNTEKKKVVRERKPNPTKENIIKSLAEYLNTIATDIIVENVGKIITFKVDNKEFKIDLTEKRQPKVK